MNRVFCEIRGIGNQKDFSLRIQQIQQDSREDFCAFEDLRIVHILSGSCQWNIEGNSYNVSRGDIVILNPTEKRAHTSIGSEEDFVQEVLSFSPAFAYPCIQCLQVFYKRPPEFHHVLSPTLSGNEGVFKDFSQISAESRTERPWREVAIRGKFLSLLSNLARAYHLPQTSFGTSLTLFETVCNTITYIGQHLKEDLSVPVLAEHSGLSVSHFSRSFSELWGLSPAEYIRIRRVRTALEMIADRQVNVLDAAYACGFTSSAGFYKAVHAVTGLSPVKAASLYSSIHSPASPNTTIIG